MASLNLNWRKNVVTKKLFRYSMGIPRYLFYVRNINSSFYSDMPILANSIPKSGTHLLINILKALPDIRDWGNFLASTPSFSFKELDIQSVKKRLDSFVPRELVGAHLFYDQELEIHINKKNIIHFFIYRDPRDIVISEAYYLSDMNRWHFLHKYFSQLPDVESKIRLSITGLDNLPGGRHYPNIFHRYSRFLPWINNESVFSVKYEDLISNNRMNIINKILEFYINQSGVQINEEKTIQQILINLNPQKSHTFRSGKSGNWKTIFTEQQKDLFKQIAGDLLIELGYEKDLDW